MGLSNMELKAMGEADKGIDALEAKLASGAVSSETAAKLTEMANCFNASNIEAAKLIQVALTGTDWAEHRVRTS